MSPEACGDVDERERGIDGPNDVQAVAICGSHRGEGCRKQEHLVFVSKDGRHERDGCAGIDEAGDGDMVAGAMEEEELGCRRGRSRGRCSGGRGRGGCDTRDGLRDGDGRRCGDGRMDGGDGVRCGREDGTARCRRVRSLGGTLGKRKVTGRDVVRYGDLGRVFAAGLGYGGFGKCGVRQEGKTVRGQIRRLLKRDVGVRVLGRCRTGCTGRAVERFVAGLVAEVADDLPVMGPAVVRGVARAGTGCGGVGGLRAREIGRRGGLERGRRASERVLCRWERGRVVRLRLRVGLRVRLRVRLLPTRPQKRQRQQVTRQCSQN